MKLKSLKAAFWLILSQIGTRSLSSIFSLLIARLLSPEIYGDFAAITIAYMFFQSVTDECSNKIIIKRYIISAVLVKHICAIVFGLGFIAALCICLWLLAFGGDNSLFWIALIVGISQILNSLSFVFVSVLQRNMQMKQIAQKNILASLLSGLFCLLLAKYGFGIYALALQLFMASAFSLAIAARQSTITFTIFPVKLNLRYAGRIISISKIYAPVQLISTANRESLRIIVGLLLGPYSLGLVTGAQKIVVVVQSLVSSSINKAVFPVICELLRTKKDDFGLKYMRIVSISICSLTFMFLAAWISSADVVRLVLGSKWLPLIPLLPALLLSGWATSIGWLNNQTMFAISQEKKQLAFGSSRLVIGNLYLLLASYFGLTAMCYVGAFRSVLVDPFHIKFFTNKLGISTTKYFCVILTSVLSGLNVVIFFKIFSSSINQLGTPFGFILKLIALVFIFFGTLFLLDRSLKSEILDIAQIFFRKNNLKA